MSDIFALSDKEAGAAVSAYLATVQKKKKVRLRVSKTAIPGHLDFSTPTVCGCIVHTNASLTGDDLRRIIERRSRYCPNGKTVAVFTTGAISGSKRHFSLWPIFNVSHLGGITPWNRRAGRFSRIHQIESNRAALFGLLFPVLLLGIPLLFVLSRAGLIAGPVGIFGTILGLVMFAVCAALVGKGPWGALVGLVYLFRGVSWLVDIPDKIENWRRKREIARWHSDSRVARRRRITHRGLDGATAISVFDAIEEGTLNALPPRPPDLT